VKTQIDIHQAITDNIVAANRAVFAAAKASKAVRYLHSLQAKA
jgi:hypothetical protein